MDRLSVERRSWNMSRIKAKNTKPEITVRSVLHRMGFRFRLHVRRLPGCPDIVLPRLKSVVLVHGCFWHRHRNCSFAYSPKTRKAFWKSKFEDNVRRDRQHLHDLAELDWRVLVIWECQIRDLNVIADRLSRFLSDR